MHPLLTGGRFKLYLLAWNPLALGLAYLLASGHRLTWPESISMVLPLCGVYLFVCLSAWYSVKATPPSETPPLRLALTHILAGAFISFLWVQLARLVAYFYERTELFPGLYERFYQQLVILFGVGFLFYLLAVSSHYVILSLETWRQAEARALESNVLARDAELKALKAQVNPHFLFNSLNSISALTSIDAGKAREMCLLLAEFLRMTLGLGEKNSVPLSDELGMLERFLAIEKVRFGARLNAEEEISQESRNVSIPPLILQPLVENAVVHGIAHLTEGGEVRLVSFCDNGRLLIVVENSYDPDAPPSGRKGMGLANVRRRLEARYGSNASVQVSSDTSKFKVILSLPAEQAEQKQN
jgi:sensor histidine kinase YesM